MEQSKNESDENLWDTIPTSPAAAANRTSTDCRVQGSIHNLNTKTGPQSIHTRLYVYTPSGWCPLNNHALKFKCCVLIIYLANAKEGVRDSIPDPAGQEVRRPVHVVHF